MLNQSYWILGTVLGLVVGAGLNDVVPHLDFALVCLFAILAYEQFHVIKAYYPIIIALFAFAIVLMPTWALLGSIAINAGVIMLRYQFFAKG